MKLFGVELRKPIEKSNVIEMASRLPAWLQEKTDSEEMTLSQAKKMLNDELSAFLKTLDPDDVELFCEFMEEEGSLLADAADDDFGTVQSEQEWSFYIRFQVSRPLGIDQRSVSFLGKYIIESDSGESLIDANILRLKILENLVWTELAQDSKKVEQALILAFAELGIGIAYPDNLASAAELEKTKKALEKDFIQHHTKRYEDHIDIPLIHWSGKFGVVPFLAGSVGWDTKAIQERTAIDIDKFNGAFAKNYDRLQNVFIFEDGFKKVETATAILTTSLFDDSLINRVILSMTAIEVLSDKPLRSDTELDALNFLAEQLSKGQFSDEVKKSLSLGLKSLRTQSIGKSCKALVKALLTKKDAELFHDLYNYRSQLVHAGALKEDQGDVYRIYVDSYSLAKRVLDAYVENISSVPS